MALYNERIAEAAACDSVLPCTAKVCDTIIEHYYC